MSEEPKKIPKGVAMMLKSILGLDPEEIQRQFNEAFALVKGFCQHADKRFIALTEEIRALKDEVAALRADREMATASEGINHAANGSDFDGRTADERRIENSV